MSVADLSFGEALTRAKAAHVKTKTFHQPGNDYRTEHKCSCGLFVFADHFDQHVIDAADALREGFHLDGGGVLYAKRVPVLPEPQEGSGQAVNTE